MFGIFCFIKLYFKIKMKVSQLPSEDYNPFYQTYISTLKDISLLDALYDGLDNFKNNIETIPIEKWNFSYADGKWSVVEVLLHIIDTERVFQYRGLCFSRNDENHFPGFEQDDYVLSGNAKTRSKESILNEFIAVRKSTIALFESFDQKVLQKRGVASNSLMSVAATGFIISGHLKHHLRILQERYF
tara:strand:- start:139749 stop:140309 length:561 start_codon:yes stop_codon:yes gene_type:complete